MKKLKKLLELQAQAKEIYSEIDKLTNDLAKLKKREWVIDDRLYYLVDNFEKEIVFKTTAIKRYEIKNKKAA